MFTERPLSVRHWCGHLGYKVENFLPWRSSKSSEEDKPWRKESSSSHPGVLLHLTLKGRPFQGHGQSLCVLSKQISASPIPDLHIENRGNKHMKVWGRSPACEVSFKQLFSYGGHPVNSLLVLRLDNVIPLREIKWLTLFCLPVSNKAFPLGSINVIKKIHWER